MKLLLILMLTSISMSVFAQDDSDWKYDDEIKAFISIDIINHNLNAMIKVSSDGGMRFGIFLPYDQCYFKEAYPEPFGSLYVIGHNENFSLQCLGKMKAVIFPTNTNVSDEIIDSLKENGNICLIVDDKTKMCFSGKGVKTLKAPTS